MKMFVIVVQLLVTERVLIDVDTFRHRIIILLTFIFVDRDRMKVFVIEVLLFLMGWVFVVSNSCRFRNALLVLSIPQSFLITHLH